MRIAQVSPLFEAVPPKAYGGTERVVSYLTEELVRLGHDVTLFASGDSVTSAHLVSPRSASTRSDPTCRDPLPHHLLMLEQVLSRAEEFDIVHFHLDLLHFPVLCRSRVPSVTTLHGRLDSLDLVPFFREFNDEACVSISHAQRAPLPSLDWAGNVYHGLPVDLYRPACEKEGSDYLLFLGRISPEKAPDEAIRIAKLADIPLKIAAKIDKGDQEYFASEIAPLLDGRMIEYLGEVDDSEKQELLARATALIFPIKWPEPFGLVMIEALACGTPVIARPCGSVPEILEDGISGFYMYDEEDGARAVRAAASLDRTRCRTEFEEKFTASRMAKNYLRVYEEQSTRTGSEFPLGLYSPAELAQPP